MKKLHALALASLLTATVVLSACNSDGESTLLKESSTPKSPAYTVYAQENYKNIQESCERFSSAFTAAIYRDYQKENNFAVSPVSVYMALALASQCAQGNTKDEILSVLKLSDNDLANSFPDFFGSLNSEWKADNGTLISALKVSNSVWVDKSLTVKQNCLDLLADSFYCSSYLADFAGNNQGANQAIRSFVKKQTNNLIDKNFDLSTDTVFSLINTLYLKDIWALNDTLNETSETYTFTNHDGSEKTLKLLQGYYLDGRAYEAEQYSTFYTTTLSGYKLKFILPAEGFTISDVFTQENIATVNALTDYHSTDDQQKIRYVTRCLFPSFEASYDNNITKILQNDFAIRDLFDKNRCNLLAFCDVPSQYDNIFCSKIQHVTKLTVDKKGIEGAAVTVESLDGVGAPLEEYTTTYLDFLLNKAFGFILTDRHNVTLFSGVVNTI